VKQFCATGMPTCRDLMEHVEFVECEVIHGLGHTSMTMAQWLITNEMILASVSSHSIGCNKPDRGTDLRSSFCGSLLTCTPTQQIDSSGAHAWQCSDTLKAGNEGCEIGCRQRGQIRGEFGRTSS